MVRNSASASAPVAASGALERVRQAVVRQRPAALLAGVPWQRVAAAVLLAGMLGAAVDFVLPDRGVDSLDAALDPLYVLDEADSR